MSWRKPAFNPTKYYENKTLDVFFQGAFDGFVKTRRNIARKSKKYRHTEFLKNRIFENLKYRQDRCPDVFFGGSHPRNTPKIPQKPDFSKITIFMVFIIFV